MRIVATTCSVLLILSCIACSRPQPPDTERPPEPQAPQQPAESEQHTQLRDAVQAPLEKAKGVEDQVLDAAKQQQAAIDAQTGG